MVDDVEWLKHGTGHLKAKGNVACGLCREGLGTSSWERGEACRAAETGGNSYRRNKRQIGFLDILLFFLGAVIISGFQHHTHFRAKDSSRAVCGGSSIDQGKHSGYSERPHQRGQSVLQRRSNDCFHT